MAGAGSGPCVKALRTPPRGRSPHMTVRDCAGVRERKVESRAEWPEHCHARPPAGHEGQEIAHADFTVAVE